MKEEKVLGVTRHAQCSSTPHRLVPGKVVRAAAGLGEGGR